MRELTQAEIELFDFTGRIPELNISGLAGKTTSHAVFRALLQDKTSATARASASRLTDRPDKINRWSAQDRQG